MKKNSTSGVTNRSATKIICVLARKVCNNCVKLNIIILNIVRWDYDIILRIAEWKKVRSPGMF